MSTDYVFSSDSTVSRESVDSTCYKTSEYFPCPHIKTIKHKTRLNCYSCGVCLHQDGVKAYKSTGMKFGTYFDPSKFYSSTLKQRIPKIVINPESEYYMKRKVLLHSLLELCEKLRLTLNTTHLAIMFMDFVLSRVTSISPNLYSVYASTCVMVAAKSVELDERIPFISKVKANSNMRNIKSEEFAHAEQVILKELNWNLQCVTPIDVVQYYLSQGIVFSTDSIAEEVSNNTSFNEENALKEKNTLNDATPTALSTKNTNSCTNKASGMKQSDSKDFTTTLNNLSIGEKENNGLVSSQNLKKKTQISELTDSKIHKIVYQIEKDHQNLTSLIMKDYRFNDFDIKVISAAAVCFLRKVNGITPAWNTQLTSLSNNQVTETMFQDCLNILENKFRSYFIPASPSSSYSKRHANLSSNQSNTLLRDSENQNKIPSSSTTPTKQQQTMFRNNLSTHTSYNKVTSAEYQVKNGVKFQQLTHSNSHNYSESSQPINGGYNKFSGIDLYKGATKNLPFNSNIGQAENTQPTHADLSKVSGINAPGKFQQYTHVKPTQVDLNKVAGSAMVKPLYNGNTENTQPLQADKPQLYSHSSSTENTQPGRPSVGKVSVTDNSYKNIAKPLQPNNQNSNCSENAHKGLNKIYGTNISKPLQFSHTNSTENTQPTQYSANSTASNSVLSNKSNYTNYQQYNSFLSSQNIHQHNAIGSNPSNNQNIYTTSNIASTNLSSNNTYLRNGTTQYQAASYIGLTRFGSNII